MKYVNSILAIFWFEVFIISLMGMILFVFLNNIVWATISGIIFGMGYTWVYDIIWCKYNEVEEDK